MIEEDGSLLGYKEPSFSSVSSRLYSGIRFDSAVNHLPQTFKAGLSTDETPLF